MYLLTELKYANSKQKSMITVAPLCLGNVSKDFSIHNREKAGLYGYVYDFSVEYDSIDVDDFLDIHKYLMKKHNIKHFYS